MILLVCFSNLADIFQAHHCLTISKMAGKARYAVHVCFDPPRRTLLTWTIRNFSLVLFFYGTNDRSKAPQHL